MMQKNKMQAALAACIICSIEGGTVVFFALAF
jgi:hypothetical protein